jgi:uncharacterized protein (UPF0248 family)
VALPTSLATSEYFVFEYQGQKVFDKLKHHPHFNYRWRVITIHHQIYCTVVYSFSLTKDYTSSLEYAFLA